MTDSSNKLPSLLVGGVPTTRITRAELARLMVEDCRLARAGLLPAPKLIVSSNGAVIADFHRDPTFRDALLKADVIDADGMPLVMATRLLCRVPLEERVATTDFINDAAEAAAREGVRFYFLGAKPGVAETAAAHFRTLYPNLQIAGVRHGYFRPEDEAGICEEIRASGADVLWIGLGSPLQEFFAVRNQHRLQGLAWIRTCGGMFDHYSGKFKRAPAWMQSIGMEWLHRSLNEPLRLGRRYLTTNLPATYYLLTQTTDRPSEKNGRDIAMTAPLRQLGVNRKTTPADRRKGAPEATIPGASKSRRVVFFVTHSNAGGAQEIWSNLAEGFQARGDNVTLAVLYPSRESRLDTPRGLPWTNMAERRPKRPFEVFGLLRNLVRFLSEERPDVVFTALPAANILLPIAAMIARVPTRVVTSHHSPSETYNPLLNLIDGLVGILPSVSDIVAVSHTVARSHHKKTSAYRAKLRTILNALPPRIEAKINTLHRQRARDVARGKVVVATGRLVPQKNYPTLVRAAVHLDSDTTIKIIGAGPDEAALHALAADLGVSDRVHFVGFHPRDDALALLAEADIFVQPSLFEGHSLALIEAAHLGLPLVVSDAPVQIEGVTNIGGHLCGVVVGVTDDVALAREIEALLANPLRYRDYADRAAQLGSEATYDRMFAAYAALAV
ncbi:WecB/TagA/CpsF family glycosyltransferase [Brevundimonas sp.]|jgi:N-acetylglucosaminyldiphosphoundecaprenol N-acetyl-beta-D-mannosaminyltransferase|uniref:WecB/TagA/CpsF family glycosyltransferase n=1 Tax=Brevundimonas sp. TaxID=1871086 RepID=UPI0037BEB2B7